MNDTSEITADRHTALHEAGHAVAHMLFRDAIPEFFASASIEETEDSAGRVILNKPPKLRDPDLFRFEDFTHPATTIKEFLQVSDEFVDRYLQELEQAVSQQEIEAQLCVALAGEAATYIVTGKRDDWGSGRDSFAGDFKTCFEFIERMFNVTGEEESDGSRAAFTYLDALFWRTVTLLDRPLWWARVNAVADALIEKRTLTAEECSHVADAALGRL